MQLLHSRRAPSRRGVWLKRALWLVVPVAGLAAWQSKDDLLQRYHYWKQQRALQQAHDFIAANDAPKAELALKVAFDAVPGSSDAMRVAADMLEQVGAPQALRLRQQICQIGSPTLQDRVALINCAIRFRDFNTARDALSGLSTTEANQPSALAAALNFALNTENAPIADALFDKLKAVHPNDQDLKVAQAILRLKHPQAEQAAAARAQLEQFAQDPKYVLRIHREFASDAVVKRDFASAERWSAAAASDPGAGLSDRLQLANLELLIDHHPFDQVYAKLAPTASGSAADAALFARWLLVQGRAAESDRWIGGLAPALKANPTVTSVAADVAATLKQWDRLQPMLDAGAWGRIAPDTLRLAMSAHLVASRENAALQRDVWDEAIRSAATDLASLRVLERLAVTWGWGAEAERTLWAIVRTFPDQLWADQVLFNTFRSHKDTASMREVMDNMRSADPSIPRYQHDWAVLSLLVEPSENWNQPKEVLKRLYERDPANPYYITSYAFALAQSGKGTQAVAVAAHLAPADRDYSPRLPYLAYIYASDRRKEDFEHVQDLARNGAFLPEEDFLFVQARRVLERKPALPVMPAKAPAKS